MLPGVAFGDPERGLGGLCAGRQEKGLIDVVGKQVCEPLGQGHAFGRWEGVAVHQPGGLLLYGLDVVRMRVPQICDQYAGGEVQILVAVNVCDPDPLAVVPDNGYLIRHARRLILV